MGENINDVNYKRVKSIYEFKVRDANKEVVRLEKYRQHVCLYVNVGSSSGFAEYTYKLLNRVYDAYELKGLRILAFPCNQFNCEEPGTLKDIVRYFHEVGARFDLFDKIDINGESAHHLFKYLKKYLPDKKTKLGVIKSNFTIFMVKANGEPYARLEPPASKDEIFAILKDFLGEPLPSAEERLKKIKIVENRDKS